MFKKKELAMILNLPSSHSSTEVKDATKDITIEMRNNEFYISGKKVSLRLIASELKGRDSKETVHIRSDKFTQYYKVIEVLDILKKNHFTNINLVTEKSK